MKKYIVSAVLSLGILVSPAFTHAAGLTSAQIGAIIGLLQSFGADQTTINNVQISLNGGTPTGTGQSFCHNFNSDLTVGNSGADISALYKVLSLTSMNVWYVDHGSSGHLVFNEDTAAKVVSFQRKYGIRMTGYVGPATRAKLNTLCGCSNQSTRPTSYVCAQAYDDQIKSEFSIGNDAKIGSVFQTVQTQAEIYWANSGNNSYTGLCTDPTVAKALGDIQTAAGTAPTCNASATAYAASSPLYSDSTKFWCADSIGFMRQVTTALGTSTVCPAQ